MNPNSKMPSAIFESIMANPIQDFNSTAGLSVLDGGNSKLQSILGKAKNVMEQSDQIKPLPQQADPYNQQFGGGYSSDGERELPSVKQIMEQNIRKKSGGAMPQQIQQPTYTPQQNTSGGIDYSLIKMMIENAVSTEFQKISGKLLTEGKKSGSNDAEFLTIGKTIKFVGKNGDVFEGTMKKTGNINK